MSSKYARGLKALGTPSSAKQIREKVEEMTKKKLTSQHVATALFTLKNRGTITQLPNGLYVMPADGSDDAI